MQQWHWILLQFSRRLWVRASLFAALAILTATLAVWLEPFIPLELPGRVGAETVEPILQILASSMLAVTTFSLSVMVSSYAAASQNVTPRVTRLLLADGTTQTALSTFVGAFLFGLVGLITLGAQLYGDRGRVILFVVTLGVVAIVVTTILRWIDYLSRFGQVDDSIGRVEAAAKTAIERRAADPFLGGRPLREGGKAIPDNAIPVYPATSGYVQNLDTNILGTLAEDNGVQIFVVAQPGTLVHPASALAYFVQGKKMDDRDTFGQSVRSAYSIAPERSFDQDPRFGLAVLSEVACKALSPAVNDSGTAISVLSRAPALFLGWVSAHPAKDDDIDVKHPKLWVPPIRVEQLFENFFPPIARDGARSLEVQIRLLKVLAALMRGDKKLAGPSQNMARDALARSRKALDHAPDVKALEAEFKRLGFSDTKSR